MCAAWHITYTHFTSLTITTWLLVTIVINGNQWNIQTWDFFASTFVGFAILTLLLFSSSIQWLSLERRWRFTEEHSIRLIGNDGRYLSQKGIYYSKFSKSIWIEMFTLTIHLWKQKLYFNYYAEEREKKTTFFFVSKWN